ncbi:MAG: N-acetyltransferase family protein [Desulfovibrionaceae bacterium]
MTTTDHTGGLVLRHIVRPEDEASVRAIVASTALFSDEELDIAAELVREHLRQGEASGYLFLFAQQAGVTVGYACYGPIPGAEGSYDLYWIAVRQDLRAKGVGSALLAAAEAAMAARQGRRIFIETSSRDDYGPTRRFYAKHGYAVEAEIRDFYRPGDHKVILGKTL